MIAINLRCEVQHGLPVVGTATPRLAWSVNSPLRGDKQTAYQIQCGSTVGAFDLWDTGKINSASMRTVYAGTALNSRKTVYWRVRIWDKNGNPSQWTTARFETGLLNLSDWGSAAFIGYQTGAVASGGYPAAFVRKAFTVPNKTVTRARLYASSLGFYYPHLNGARIGQVEMAPGWTDPATKRQYQTYDVTSNIVVGSNAVGLHLGDGHIYGNLSDNGRGAYYTPDIPRAVAALYIDYSDGTSDLIVSDASWKAAVGSNQYNDIYTGCTEDTRLNLLFTRPLIDDTSYPNVTTSAIGSVPLVAQPMPHIRKIEAISAVSVAAGGGGYIFDMGQNHAGVPRLTVSGLPYGTVITTKAFEDFKKDGSGVPYVANLRSAIQLDTFTSDGSAIQTFEPRHTYHGGRYYLVTGLVSAPTASMMKSCVMHADSPKVGTFSCSNTVLNQIWNASVWSHRSNLYSVITDCPQRNERLGWTGDAQCFAEAGTFQYDILANWEKFCADAYAQTQSNGGGPDTAPYITQYGHSSNEAVASNPWIMWKAYGDSATALNALPTMIKVLGSLPLSANPYGDFLNLGESVDVDVLRYAISYRVANMVADVAQLAGDTTTYNNAITKASSALSNFQALVASDGTVQGGSQCGYVLGLAFGMIPTANISSAVSKLVSSINTNGLKVGLTGLLYLYDALADNGALDLAYQLATSVKFPSLGYTINVEGCTTLGEQWNPRTFQSTTVTSQDANSYNHKFRGGIAGWMMRTVAGIASDPATPGFGNIIMRPRPHTLVISADAAFLGPRGRIESHWLTNSKGMSWNIVIPANSTATITIPPAYTKATVEGVAISTIGTATTADPVTGGQRYNMPSGSYSLQMKA